MKKIVTIFLAVLIMTCTFVPVTANAELAETCDYYLAVYSNEAVQKVPIPKAFTHTLTIRNIDDSVPKFNSPSDLFIDESDNIYIVDSGNNRIVKTDRYGNLIGIFDTVEGSSSATFNNPGGIYVDSDEDMYIADTNNNRIVHLGKDGEFIEEFGKPDAEALRGYPFDPTKVYISNTGIIYVLLKTDFQGFMMISNQGEYLGSTGSTWVTSTFWDYISRRFGSDEQLVSQSSLVAPPYQNFIMDANGWIYATVGTVEEDQIVKLNSQGTNTYPKGVYGEILESTPENISKYTGLTPNMTDIAVDSDNMIYVLDRNLCRVYMYDQNGNNLAFFGDRGNITGKFMTPISIGVMSDGTIAVLDMDASMLCVQLFAPTSFAETVISGTVLYNDGLYEEAREYWNTVLSMDENYMFAHRSIARALVKDGEYREAMAEYKLADDKEGYSTAFENYKDSLIQNGFFFVVLGVVVIIILLILAFKKLKRYADKLHLRYTTWIGGEDE